MTMVDCPICLSGRSAWHASIDGYAYFTCGHCGSIHIAPAVLDMLDAGGSLVGDYTDAYWEQERVGAIERAAGVSLCLLAEAILYCRRPVRRFLDVGAGPGFLLHEAQRLLDPDAEVFHGVEKFPPPYAVSCPNFQVGDVNDIDGTFDAGVCIEVVEHLTPAMLDGLVRGLARASEPGALWLFNTGMPDYVRNEDPAYLDPLGRGHIISWSLAGISPIFERHGFRVLAMPARSFGFIVERLPAEDADFATRIYQPVAANHALLQRSGLLYHAGFETARSYYYQSVCTERTSWALALKRALARARDRSLWARLFRRVEEE
ncbi:MAG TPA: class I SAM-dependent methyltransferase [Thermomonas sp.]|nr:class I SAM-dependent methyltransferase [Thermomonas sp.]